MATGLALDDVVEHHDSGPNHPESPARVAAIRGAFQRAGLVERCTKIQWHNAARADLAAVHTENYVDLVEREIGLGRSHLSTGDTPIGKGSWEAALAAAGMAMGAVEQVAKGKLENAFCVVRPPGHHASPVRGMGFCIFNNVAVAARYAQRKFGLERVAIVDWDVHHGNGTQDIFYEDGRVHFFSTHQAPWYPGTGWPDETGRGKGLGKILNVPLPAGSGMAEVGSAFRNRWVPAMRDFAPDLILISAGFDGRKGDPLGGFLLEDGDFRELTAMVLDVAGKYCGHRVVSVLEGGYQLAGLASAAVAHLQALMGISAPD
jgi:acetoin utilization deacetylase AcuC-like enzyme